MIFKMMFPRKPKEHYSKNTSKNPDWYSSPKLVGGEIGGFEPKMMYTYRSNNGGKFFIMLGKRIPRRSIPKRHRYLLLISDLTNTKKVNQHWFYFLTKKQMRTFLTEFLEINRPERQYSLWR